MDAKERFKNKCKIAPDSGCWIWQGGKNFRLGNGETIGPRAAAYELFIGPRPKRRKLVSTCGNPKCVNPDHLPSDPDLGRFFSFVTQTPSGCWLWKGATDKDGYGLFKVDGKTVQAHIWFWVKSGRDHPNPLQLNHNSCPKHCVNPEHLKAETQAENMRDRVLDDNINTGYRFGNKNGNTIKSELETWRIKQAFFNHREHSSSVRESLNHVAKQFGINRSSLSNWVRGLTADANEFKKKQFKYNEREVPKDTKAFLFQAVDYRECRLYQNWGACCCKLCPAGPGFRQTEPGLYQKGDIVEEDGQRYMVQDGKTATRVKVVTASGKAVTLDTPLQVFSKDLDYLDKEPFNAQFAELTNCRPIIVSTDDYTYSPVKQKRRLTSDERVSLLAKYGNKCQGPGCGIELTVETMTADRIIPGSDYSIEGCVPKCKSCNSKRQDKPFEE